MQPNGGDRAPVDQITDDFRIVAAPYALRDQIKAWCRSTFDEHRARQPFAFPENAFELLLEGEIDRAFHNKRGTPQTQSPTIFVAQYGDGSAAGYIKLSDWSREDSVTMPYVSIEDVFVQPQFRGQGLAQAMVQHVKSLADQRGWSNLTADVWAENDTSVKLFKRAGFKIQSQTFRYGPDEQAGNYPVGLTKKSLFGFSLTIALIAILVFFATIAFLIR